MNPFSAFLQPVQQRSPLQGAAETVQNLSRMDFARKQEDNRVREASLDNTRADQYLKLQQGDLAHRFNELDQKKLMALTEAYKLAEDQGDQVQMSRALQDLKAFGGADVSQGGTKPAPALPGQLLPSVQIAGGGAPNDFTGTAPKDEPDLSQEDFEAQLTGEGKNPIDQAAATELSTRDKLRARNETAEPDIAGHLKSVAPLKALKLNTPEQQASQGSDLTDPGTQSAGSVPASEVMDLDAPGALPKVAKETQSAAPQVAGERRIPQLPGQSLPTVISKGGKTIYESTGPSGRWQPMVASVFEPLAQNQNPEVAQAAKNASDLAQRLVAVDGVSPKDAIEFAAKRFEAEAGRIINLERTKLGSKPRGGGAGGSAVGDAALTGKELALLGDDAQQLMLSITAKPEYQKVSVMDDVLNGAESALQSNDPLRQQQAISDIMRARSGLTVRKDEEQSLKNAAGLWEGLRANLSQKSGYGLTEDYRNSLAQAITAQRAINQQIRRRIAQETKQFYITTRTTSDTDTGSRATQVRRNAGGVEKMLSRSAGGDPDADLDQ